MSRTLPTDGISKGKPERLEQNGSFFTSPPTKTLSPWVKEMASIGVRG